MATLQQSEPATCGLCNSPLLMLLKGNRPLIACPGCRWIALEHETTQWKEPPHEDEGLDNLTR